MNRRSFITKAVAALAAVPLIGKLVNSQHSALQVPYRWQSHRMAGLDQAGAELPQMTITVERYPDPPVWVALGTRNSRGRFIELRDRGYERLPLKKGDLVFPPANRTYHVTHLGIADSKHGPVKHAARLVGTMSNAAWVARGNNLVLSDFGFVLDC